MKKSIRHQAVDILNTVSRTQAFAADLLDACLDRQGLSETADGGLLTHLVYGVLRMQAHLDWILAGLYHGNYSKTHVRVKYTGTGPLSAKIQRPPPPCRGDRGGQTAKKMALRRRPDHALCALICAIRKKSVFHPLPKIFPGTLRRATLILCGW